MEAFVNEVIMAYGNWRFLMLTSLLLIVGLMFLKGYRKRFVILALILTAVILNPAFYKLWYKFNDRSYWRMMWMVPIIPICVIVPTYFVDKSKKDIVKFCILIITTSVMILCGHFIYDGNREVFAVASNPEKLPDDVATIGKALLELDDDPNIVTDASLSVYLRQYSGKIKSPYSRHVGYDPMNPYGNNFSNALDEERFSYLAQKMVNCDYEYLVTHNAEEDRRTNLYDAGFKLIQQIGEYGIYGVEGTKTEFREYNEKHQLINNTQTYEDITDGKKKLVKTIYEYDNYDRVICLKNMDEDGNSINIQDGSASIRYVYPDFRWMHYTYCYDENDSLLECETGFFHDFFSKLKNENVTIFIAAMDDASSGVSSIIMKDFKEMGIKTDLRDKYRESYIAVIKQNEVTEKIGIDIVEEKGIIEKTEYHIISAGALAGSYSSIVINGIDYSVNKRGLNVVVLDNETMKVRDSICFDTFETSIPTYRCEPLLYESD